MSRAWLLKLFARVVLPQVGAAVAVELLQLGAIDHDDGDGAVPDDLSELNVNQRGEAVQVRFRNRLQQDRRHFVPGAASGRSVASVTNARAHQQAVFELHREDLINVSTQITTAKPTATRRLTGEAPLTLRLSQALNILAMSKMGECSWCCRCTRRKLFRYSSSRMNSRRSFSKYLVATRDDSTKLLKNMLRF